LLSISKAKTKINTNKHHHIKYVLLINLVFLKLKYFLPFKSIMIINFVINK